MFNYCQGLKGRHIEPSRTAQCVGPLGLFLVLTIAYRGLSASAGLFAGSHRPRIAVFTP